MTTLATAPAPPSVPRWLPWCLLGLLSLPFHPYWVDFEQVRRGLLLLLTGAVLVVWPRLPRVRGENAVLTFIAFLAICSVISIKSLQGFEAIYRLAQWITLLGLLRIGAACRHGFATPIAVLLLSTSVYGILQRLGLVEFCGYGVEREPVSVFGNLNVASEFTAAAAMAVAVLGTPRAWLGRTAMVAAGAYLIVDQSRSGMYALPIGLLLLVLQQRRAISALPLLLALLGGGAGWLVHATVARPPAADAVAMEAARNRSSATDNVRLEIAHSCSQLFAERPLFGWGPGQFAVQYPRVRSQKELELSSHGRQFATEVRTAHDDWLELLVDGGLPALGLFAAMLFAMQRGNRDKVRLLPLFVVLLMMFVRAPLGNAPVFAIAMLLVGTQAPGIAPPSPRIVWSTRGLALLIAALGLPPVIANTLFAPYQSAKAHGNPPPRSAVTGAVAWMPWEPRWLQVLAQEELLAGELASARKNAARALQLRPHEPQLFLLLGEVMARGTDYGHAAELASAGLAVDPPNPELRVLLSTARFQQHDLEGAIEAVVQDPHPALRAQLATHFHSLEKLAVQQNYAAGAARCQFERACLEAMDSLRSQTPEALLATKQALSELVVAAKAAGRTADLRVYALHALQALQTDSPDVADGFAKAATKNSAKLEPWQRDLLGEQLRPLRQRPAWRDLLR